MATEALELAITTTRGVLAQVSADQMDRPTPCAKWDVAGLINHIVGGQHFFAAGIAGDPLSDEEVDFASGDYLAAFDDASRAAVAAFQVDGALGKTISLPFGDMPGAAFMGLATSDTFTHGWDLARATGQDTDLAPDLAAQVLEQMRASIQPAFRSEDGAVFGPERSAPDGAPTADQLAAFLGRTV